MRTLFLNCILITHFMVEQLERHNCTTQQMHHKYLMQHFVKGRENLGGFTFWTQ